MIDKLIAEKAARINDIVESYLPPADGFNRTVCEAMAYSVEAGGKRLRPMLMEETYRLFGGKSEVIKPFMAAIEMIHTYSLIHDDLPALDNDDYRRGRKTSHVVFGEAMAILAGDALLNYAYETACKAFGMGEDIHAVASAMCVLAQKPGINGMIGGQVVDVEMTGKELSKEQLEYVYENKTGALIEASMPIRPPSCGRRAMSPSGTSATTPSWSGVWTRCGRASGTASAMRTSTSGSSIRMSTSCWRITGPTATRSAAWRKPMRTGKAGTA